MGFVEADQSAELCASSDCHDALQSYPSIPSVRPTKVFSKTNGRSGCGKQHGSLLVTCALM